MAISGANLVRSSSIYLDDVWRPQTQYIGDILAPYLLVDFEGQDQDISGDAEGPRTFVSGDFVYFDQKATGGDDRIDVSAAYVYGDADTSLSNSIQRAGQDTITLRKNAFDDEYQVVGDVKHIGEAVFFGGDDTIVAFRSEDARGKFYGDGIYLYDGAKGFGGNDRIKGSNADDLIYGDFYGTETAELARGGDDSLWGYGGDDTLVGDAWMVFGNLAEAGDDVIYGGAGDDTIYGDMMSGGVTDAPGASLSGRDKLYGGNGDDTIWAGIGADLARGGRGRDFIDGGDGNDTIRGDAGKDELHGGSGDDSIAGGAGSDRIFGDIRNGSDPALEGDDVILGGNGNDRVWAGGGDDLVKGGNGRDHLLGGDGDDTLDGGRHSDRIDGGAGADVLTGGRDADVFVFADIDGDRITDFSADEGDRIDLSGVAEIAGWRDLRRSHLDDGDADDGAFSISVDDRSIVVEGLDRGDLSRDDFIF